MILVFSYIKTGVRLLTCGLFLMSAQSLFIKPAMAMDVQSPAIIQLAVSSIWDGDSLRSGELRLRLHGIDAPEKKQRCSDALGIPYPCGEKARDALANLLPADNLLTCILKDVDRYRRLIVLCYRGQDASLSGPSLNEEMIASGWALAYRRYAPEFISIEEQASQLKKGMWQGSFMCPEDWRKQQ